MWDPKGCGRHLAAVQEAIDGRATITVWAHDGKPEEWKTIQEQVKQFNAIQTNVSEQFVEIAEARNENVLALGTIAS